MTTEADLTIKGTQGTIIVRTWPNADAKYIAILAHGFGEHSGRYVHVAGRLHESGAVVYAPDHHGHGRSDGERALVTDMDVLAADLHVLVGHVKKTHPGLQLVLIGHSMGGVIATRYAQLHGGELAALVLSGPVIGGNPGFEALLAMDPIPEIPIDPAVLSRDAAVGVAYANDPLVYHGALKRPTLQALFGIVSVIAKGPSFGALPTLWMHGENDALAPLASTRPAIERIRGTNFTEKVYPGAAHEIFNETNRAEVIADTLAFIERALGTKTP